MTKSMYFHIMTQAKIHLIVHIPQGSKEVRITRIGGEARCSKRYPYLCNVPVISYDVVVLLCS